MVDIYLYTQTRFKVSLNYCMVLVTLENMEISGNLLILENSWTTQGI